MTCHSLEGQTLAQHIRTILADEVLRLKQQHYLQPGLAVVQVGSSLASKIYVEAKRARAKEIGMEFIEYILPATVSFPILAQLLDNLNYEKKIHGIILQLPLPDHLSAREAVELITPAKDVDGLTAHNLAQMIIGKCYLVPCTPMGCIFLLKSWLKKLEGLHAVVIGRSNLVGNPLAALLLQQNCTVTVAHSKSQDLPHICRQADIVIAATGKAKLVTKEWIKPGATVIDVGIHRSENGRTLIGDVDFEQVKHVAGALTPVPGGVGPLTVTCLLLNTLLAAATQNKIELAAPVRELLARF